MPATYYAAGESESIPVSKTSTSDGLSESAKRQILRETLQKMCGLEFVAGGCWILPSTMQNAYQTAEVHSKSASLIAMGSLLRKVSSTRGARKA